MRLPDAIAAREVHLHELTRILMKGEVTGIDTAVSPDIYTVNGRTMVFLDTGTTIAVGDVVCYLDFIDPIGLGKVVDTV